MARHPRTAIRLLIVLGVAMLSFSAISATTWAWWNSSWGYRVPVTIDNTGNSNTLTDYQVLVTLDTATLIADGKMNSDCSDLRVVDSDDTTQLSFWIEDGTCDTAETHVWVKVPSIPASDTKTIYVYYGNPAATTSTSSIDDTFIFGDDFNDGTLDTSKWSLAGGTTVTFSDGKVTIQVDSSINGWSREGIINPNLDLYTVMPVEIVSKGSAQETTTESDPLSIHNTINVATESYTTIACWQWWYNPGDYHVRYKTGATSYANSYSDDSYYLVDDGFHDFGVIIKTRTDYVFYYDSIQNSLEKNDVYSESNAYLLLGSGYQNDKVTIDYVYVKKYADPEPSTSTGTEEASISFNPLVVQYASVDSRGATWIVYNLSVFVYNNYTSARNYTVYLEDNPVANTTYNITSLPAGESNTTVFQKNFSRGETDQVLYIPPVKACEGPCMSNTTSNSLYIINPVDPIYKEWLSVTLDSPANASTVSTSTPVFNYTVYGSDQSYECLLKINGTPSAYAREQTIDTEASYSCIGSFDKDNPCTNAVDEDWDTYTTAANGEGPAYVHENYTIPSWFDPDTGIAYYTGAYSQSSRDINVTCKNTTGGWETVLYGNYYLTGGATKTAQIPAGCLENGVLQLSNEVYHSSSGVGGSWVYYYEGMVEFRANNGSAQNNTLSSITPDSPLSDGTYEWRIECNATEEETGRKVTNQSATWLVTIATGGFQSFTRAVADTIGLGDTPAGTILAARLATTLLGFTLEDERLAAYQRFATSPVGIVDALYEYATISRRTETTIPVSGLADATLYYQRHNIQQVGLAELLARLGVYTRTPTQAVSLQDLERAVSQFEREGRDTITLAELEERLYHSRNTITQPLSLTEITDRIEYYNRYATQEFSLLGLATRLVSYDRDTALLVGLADTLRAIKIAQRGATDTITTSEAQKILQGVLKTTRDTITLQELATRYIGYTKNPRETVLFGTVLETTRSVSRLASEGLSLGVLADRTTEYARTASLSLGLLGNPVATRMVERQAVQALSMSEYPARTVLFFRTVTDAVTATDEFAGWLFCMIGVSCPEGGVQVVSGGGGSIAYKPYGVALDIDCRTEAYPGGYVECVLYATNYNDKPEVVTATYHLAGTEPLEKDYSIPPDETVAIREYVLVPGEPLESWLEGHPENVTLHVEARVGSLFAIERDYSVRLVEWYRFYARQIILGLLVLFVAIVLAMEKSRRALMEKLELVVAWRARKAKVYK